MKKFVILMLCLMTLVDIQCMKPKHIGEKDEQIEEIFGAIKNNNGEKLSLLLDERILEYRQEGETPLTFAAKLNKVALVKIILGFSPEFSDKRTAFRVTTSNEIKQMIIDSELFYWITDTDFTGGPVDSPEKVKELIEVGQDGIKANINARYHINARFHKYNKVNDYTPLMYAAYYVRPVMVKYLLDQGADTSLISDSGETLFDIVDKYEISKNEELKSRQEQVQKIVEEFRNKDKSSEKGGRLSSSIHVLTVELKALSSVLNK